MTPEPDISAPDQFATASVVFGLVSLMTCWWFPFGALIGALGAGWGFLAWCWGTTGERALVGLALAACGSGAGVLLAWDYWQRTLGL